MRAAKFRLHDNFSALFQRMKHCGKDYRGDTATFLKERTMLDKLIVKALVVVDATGGRMKQACLAVDRDTTVFWSLVAMTALTLGRL